MHDGDTFTVERENGERERIRLFGVDCPEAQYTGRWESQPYSRIATNFVKDMLKDNKRVSIFEMGMSYDRVVGAVVKLDSGKTVQGEIIGAGLAWVYPRYCKNSVKECKNWKALQEEAKAEKRGLWRGSNPIAPWDWRKGKTD